MLQHYACEIIVEINDKIHVYRVNHFIFSSFILDRQFVIRTALIPRAKKIPNLNYSFKDQVYFQNLYLSICKYVV